jgi:hypothetical protein
MIAKQRQIVKLLEWWKLVLLPHRCNTGTSLSPLSLCWDLPSFSKVTDPLFSHYRAHTAKTEKVTHRLRLCASTRCEILPEEPGKVPQVGEFGVTNTPLSITRVQRLHVPLNYTQRQILKVKTDSLNGRRYIALKIAGKELDMKHSGTLYIASVVVHPVHPVHPDSLLFFLNDVPEAHRR